MSGRQLIAAVAVLAGSVAISPAPPVPKPVTHTVVIEGMEFRPGTLSIRRGDSVRWVNKDIVEHTATTPQGSKRPFDSRMIRAGNSWKRTFTQAGTYDYLCTYHPTMKGVIRVGAGRAG